MTRARRPARTAALLLLAASLLAGGCASRSRPWACCGQECGSECWPGPRLGCPQPCLQQPCPPERWTPAKPCTPR